MAGNGDEGVDMHVNLPSTVEITNLLYRYAELMDAGDFDGAAALFDHAELILDRASDHRTDAAGMLAIWQSMVIVHDDGTPRTKHLTTNPIVEVDEATGTATCRSTYTVLQQIGDGPLQPIVAGRYHDRFERVGDVWRFSERDYSMMDLVGDVSNHLRQR